MGVAVGGPLAATPWVGMAGRVVYAALGGSPVAVAASGGVGGAVGAVVGGPPAAAVATGANGSVRTGSGHPINIALALVAVQRVRRHFVPRHFSDAELRTEDRWLQWLTDADRRLCGIYGNTIHQNDGTNLDGGNGVGEDAMWQ